MIFLRIKKIFSRIFRFINKFPQYLLNCFKAFIFFIHKAKIKVKNLFQTNLQLGVYHIKNGNIKDAIFRFKILHCLFGKGHKDSHYWLGWSYLLSQNPRNIQYAKIAFDASDDLNLVKFFHNFDEMKIIPYFVLKTYRNLTARYYHRKILSQEILNHFFFTNLKLVLNLLVKQASSKGDIKKDCAFLEIFHGSGFLGKLVKREIPDVVLDGIEISPHMSRVSKLFKIYSNGYLLSSWNYFADLSLINRKYNLIYIAQSFGYAQDLQSMFKWVKASLQQGGYFAFLAFIISDTVVNCKFNFQYFQFSYTKSYIESLIKSFEFQLLNQYNYHNSSKGYFSMFVLK